MTIPEYEDVPGAAAAGRATVAREYALRRIAVDYDDAPPTHLGRATTTGEHDALRAQEVAALESGAQYAGLTLAEVDAAELELRRVYVTDECRRYLRETARHHLALLQLPEPDGPPEDGDDHRRSDGMPL